MFANPSPTHGHIKKSFDRAGRTEDWKEEFFLFFFSLLESFATTSVLMRVTSRRPLGELVRDLLDAE